MSMRRRTIFLLSATATASGVVLWARARAHQRASTMAGRLRRNDEGAVHGAESIALEGDGRGALLLLHGFGDTPQSLEWLARNLNAAGWTVRVPLLPGHGATLDAFRRSGRDAWLGAARDALAELRAAHRRVFVLGQSMGGALATLLAAEHADLPGLVLLAPYLGMPGRVRWAARSGRVWGVVAPWVVAADVRSIRDPAERAASLAYGAVSPNLLAELFNVSEEARAAAAQVRAPVLVIFARRDNRIPPAEAERAFAALGSREKWLVWLEEPGHVVSVDVGRERVFSLVGQWIGRKGGARS